MCREHHWGWGISGTSSGSSPRVQGTRITQFGTLGIHRFIPACAGNTQSIPMLSVGNPVHPRVCREHVLRERLGTHPNGSSPRVQGTRRSAERYVYPHRFIPACAGNTDWRVCWAVGVPVHPRVCREHPPISSMCIPTGGSSPRVQGTHQVLHLTGRFDRFIPACAGNTLPIGRPRATGTVHPRVCREHYEYSKISTLGNGSSPRVQGTRPALRLSKHPARFIPACAGNTALTFIFIVDLPVHPRVCREHPNAASLNQRITGSSPRVQGTRTPAKTKKR